MKTINSNPVATLVVTVLFAALFTVCAVQFGFEVN